MFYRNLTLFRFNTNPGYAAQIAEILPDVIGLNKLKPVGPLELSSHGWVSPFGAGSDEMLLPSGRFVGLTLGFEEKLLPGSVVNKQLAERLEHIRESEGRNPGGRERKRIKDEIITDLLPRAFVRPSRLDGFIDLQDGWCVIDTSSRKAAETFVTAIREALGSFPAVPVNAVTSSRSLMTAWVAGEPLPECFTLGDKAELRDPVDSGAIVKVRRQELLAEEVQEHLKCGKQAFALGLNFHDRLSFVLSDDLVIRKLRFHEVTREVLDQGDHDNQRDEREAIFAIQTGEIMGLLKSLGDSLGFCEVGA
jgi:recombination associated protein RdgC